MYRGYTYTLRHVLMATAGRKDMFKAEIWKQRGDQKRLDINTVIKMWSHERKTRVHEIKKKKKIKIVSSSIISNQPIISVSVQLTEQQQPVCFRGSVLL